MASRITADSFNPLNLKQVTKTNADNAAGDTVVIAQDATNIATGDICFVGVLGRDETEKRSVTVAGPNLTVSALTYAHSRFEPVTDVLGDQVQFYRAPALTTSDAPPDGSFVLLSTPINIQANSLTTTYVDPVGGSAYWYKYVYWNSVANAAVSYLGDVQATRGGDTGVYTTPTEVRNEVGFKNNQNVTDVYIASFIATACNYVDSSLFGLYPTPFQDPVPETVREVTKLYASGLLLKAEYGVFATGSQADGNDKIKQAKIIIDRLVKLEEELFDQFGTTLRQYNLVAGWPDDSAEGLDEFDANGNPTHGGGPAFRRLQDF